VTNTSGFIKDFVNFNIFGQSSKESFSKYNYGRTTTNTMHICWEDSTQLSPSSPLLA